MASTMWTLPLPVATGAISASAWVVSAHAVQAQEVSEPLTASEEVLRGRVARREWVVPVADPASPPRLTLDFEHSAMVDVERSALTVYVNGRPFSSVRLVDLDGGMTVDLPQEAGFQRVSLDSRLFVEGDPCLLDYRDAAWLRVLPTSRVTYERRPAETVFEESQPVAETAERWRSSGADRVAVDLPVVRTTEDLLALVDIDHLVRDWGFEPEYGADGVADAPRLLVTLGGGADDASRAAIADARVGALARAEGPRLLIHATDASGLSRMAALLRQPEALDLCPGSACMVGTRFDGAGAQDGERAASRATFDLLDAGYPEGWVAAGAGRHQLQFVWPRPPWWRLQRWPELRLRARVGVPDGSGGGSRVIAHLNGQPLATWSLEERENDLVALSVRIPPQFWSAGEWVVRITVRLDDDDTRCAALDPDELWMVLEPESGLYVPRTEDVFDGISDFVDAHPVPVVTGDSTLASRHVGALAAVLYPFHRTASATGPFRWDAFCEAGCVQVAPIPEAPPTDTVTASGDTWVLDREGALRIPLLPESGHYQLRREGGTLVLSVPNAPRRIAAPDLLALRGGTALYAGGAWVVREAETPNSVVSVGVEGSESTLMSYEQRRARLIDFLWLCFALATLVLGGFWIADARPAERWGWRGYRDRNRSGDGELEHSGD